MSRKLILKILTGSRAYGLHTPESDYDYHGVYVTPTSELLAVGANPRECSGEWYESEKEDFQAWEIGHFLDLATRGNPTVLETFVAPVVISTPLGFELRGLLPFVLSKHKVYNAFRGYAKNQRAKLFNKPDDPTSDQPSKRTWKFAVQYLRVLMQGERLLRTGEFCTDMYAYQHRYKSWGIGMMLAWSCLVGVRDGQYSLGKVIDWARVFEDIMKEAFLSSKLPDEPDMEKVNKFLLKVRKEIW